MKGIILFWLQTANGERELTDPLNKYSFSIYEMSVPLIGLGVQHHMKIGAAVTDTTVAGKGNVNGKHIY